ncbi:MAG TPA: hypothetical protein VNN22_24195 [Verrucomicrobiae bacterium]|nr:hypothetical protein [Verrucomicrobiae bacterium]
MIDTLHPFTAAVRANEVKSALPSDLSSAELRTLDAAVKRKSFISARTMLTDLLDQYKFDVESIINPKTEQRADRVTPENPEGNVTTGLNQAYARQGIKDLLRGLGYAPEPGEAGTLKDLSSNPRINLVLKTNTELAQGAGRFIQMNNPDVLDQFPAQELVRFEQRMKVRDWEARWAAAADESGDEDAAKCLEDSGRMVALKDSEIWQALGDGAGGYDDTLGNPYPPFAFNSGMWVQSVSRSDAEELGLIDPGEKAEPHPLDLGELFGVAA